MGDHHYSNAILAAFGGFAGGLCAYLLTGYVVTESAWCIAGEDHCLRDWIAALSGWVAAAAAFTTIGYLARQASEARRQTEFIVGDALPSVSFIDTPVAERLNGLYNRIRITNWNRNPILVTRIEADNDTDADEIRMEAAAPSYLMPFDNEHLEKYPPITLGWVDRSKPPPSYDIDVVCLFPVSKLAQGNDLSLRRYAGFNIHITIAGNQHTKVVLHASRPDAMVHVSSFER